MEEVTDTASFSFSRNFGACGRGWPLWCMYLLFLMVIWHQGQEWPHDDSGYWWKSAKFMKLPFSVPFSTSSHCWCALLTQRTGTCWLPWTDMQSATNITDRHRGGQREKGREGVLQCGVYVSVCVCTCTCMIIYRLEWGYLCPNVSSEMRDSVKMIFPFLL